MSKRVVLQILRYIFTVFLICGCIGIQGAMGGGCKPTSYDYNTKARKQIGAGKWIYCNATDKNVSAESCDTGDVVFIDSSFFSCQPKPTIGNAYFSPYVGFASINTCKSIKGFKYTSEVCKSWGDCLTKQSYKVYFNFDSGASGAVKVNKSDWCKITIPDEKCLKSGGTMKGDSCKCPNRRFDDGACECVNGLNADGTCKGDASQITDSASSSGSDKTTKSTSQDNKAAYVSYNSIEEPTFFEKNFLGHEFGFNNYKCNLQSKKAGRDAATLTWGPGQYLICGHQGENGCNDGGVVYLEKEKVFYKCNSSGLNKWEKLDKSKVFTIPEKENELFTVYKKEHENIELRVVDCYDDKCGIFVRLNSKSLATFGFLDHTIVREICETTGGKYNKKTGCSCSSISGLKQNGWGACTCKTGTYNKADGKCTSGSTSNSESISSNQQTSSSTKGTCTWTTRTDIACDGRRCLNAPINNTKLYCNANNQNTCNIGTIVLFDFSVESPLTSTSFKKCTANGWTAIDRNDIRNDCSTNNPAETCKSYDSYTICYTTANNSATVTNLRLCATAVASQQPAASTTQESQCAIGEKDKTGYFICEQDTDCVSGKLPKKATSGHCVNVGRACKVCTATACEDGYDVHQGYCKKQEKVEEVTPVTEPISQPDDDECVKSGGILDDNGECVCDGEILTQSVDKKTCVEREPENTTPIDNGNNTPPTAQIDCDATKHLVPNQDGTACECDDGYDIDTETSECVERFDTNQESPSVDFNENTDIANNNEKIVENQPTKLELAEDEYKTAKENEQSFANRMLGGATTAATGLGMMTAASARAEQRADADAEQDMNAYLATFKCEYGRGMSAKAGNEEITLPGGNELVAYYSEYKQLADSLKNTKKALGLRPGIEEEIVYDKAETGLYKYASTGITSGAYTSLSRALTDEDGADAAAWNAQKEETAKKLKTGVVAAGAGVAGGIVGDTAINTDTFENIIDKFKE